jgi:membrane protein YdbS with pleckstrin-like domain
MRLFVSRNGRQLGPYTLEQAGTLVAAGELAPTDWAWPEGATQWVALKDVAGFSAPAPSAMPPAPPAGLVPEEELWRGRPSQILNLKIYFAWGIILFGVLSATLVQREYDSWPLLVGAAVAAAIHITLRNLKLRAIEYVVTVQRVRVISGLLNKNIQEIELFRVKDTMVYQRFFQRLFGLGTITIVSGDRQNPRLVLYGIPHAVELRERLRSEVMILRQRYGVREMDLM